MKNIFNTFLKLLLYFLFQVVVIYIDDVLGLFVKHKQNIIVLLYMKT